MEKVLQIKYGQWLILFMVMLMFIILPSVSTEGPVQGTVSGKMFFFTYMILAVGALSFLYTVIHISPHIRFGNLDAVLAIWAVFVLLNVIVKHVPVSVRLLEFCGLTVLYVVLRQIESSKVVQLLTAIVVGGIIQAIIGNLQLWGFYPSHHSLFRMTGNFFNPGPYAGYLASAFPVALGLYLFHDKLFTSAHKNLCRRIAGITVVVILTVLPVSQSRAAWLSVIISSVVILMARYPVVQWLKKQSRLKQAVILLMICIIIVAGLAGLFKYKTDSSNGRLLIWKITMGMIARQPLTGVGIDRFKTFYMNEQADYFEDHPESAETMIAGDTNYCFNEFLQHTAENGLIGLGLMLTAIVFAFRMKGKQNDNAALIAKAGITGIAVFALFSYISSLKILQQKTDVRINEHPNIRVDRENQFDIPTDNRIYPCVVYMKNGKVDDYSFQRPGNDAFHVLEDVIMSKQ
jgi:O-antigen ligase